MSFRVLVIPEDPTYNGAILNPLVCRMLESCGKPKARVKVLEDPRSQGFDHAKRLLTTQVLDSYRHFDLLLFMVDRDGKNREPVFQALEQEASDRNIHLVCCAAVEEVEAWLLAGHVEKLGRAWAEVRANVSVKEEVFEDFLSRFGDSRRYSGGRDLLMREALQNYPALLNRCPELADLEGKIRAHLGRRRV